MNEKPHLPTRKARLGAFVKLKIQRRYLIGAVALLLPASTALAIGYAEEADSPERVALGTGVAGVNQVPEPVEPRVTYQPQSAAPSEPVAEERELTEGMASYYGRRFAGQRTASGERFDPSHLTAAHRTLPFGSRVRVTYPHTGKSVVVRINDRGPFHRARVIDISEAAARQLGLVARGRGLVRLSLLTG